MATCGNEIHLNDIGTIFEIALKDCENAVDLTGATTLEYIFQKPDSSTVTKTAIVAGDPTLGILNYTTISGDLDALGNWKIQAHVVLPSGEWRSDIEKFKVHANLS